MFLVVGVCVCSDEWPTACIPRRSCEQKQPKRYAPVPPTATFLRARARARPKNDRRARIYECKIPTFSEPMSCTRPRVLHIMLIKQLRLTTLGFSFGVLFSASHHQHTALRYSRTTAFAFACGANEHTRLWHTYATDPTV